MGLLVDGVWHDKWYDTGKSAGRFVRSEAQFRNWITPNGEPGPTGKGGFKAEPGRYHLYVSLACPWAHRTLIFRQIKGLTGMIDVSVVHWLMREHGWTFAEDADHLVGDKLSHADYMYQVYLRADPGYSGRVTVPVLWDTREQTIVSNESADIIRMFNDTFDQCGAQPGNYYPDELRAQIDEVNERIYHTLNNGVYKCGFATTQDAYEEALWPLFETLDWLEQHLGSNRYLAGDRITEADWRLFTTLFRFDPVYVGHFKCNIRRLVDYPNLWDYTRALYQLPGIAGTCNLQHIKSHYYASHHTINPSGVVPAGPDIDYAAPAVR